MPTTKILKYKTPNKNDALKKTNKDSKMKSLDQFQRHAAHVQ